MVKQNIYKQIAGFHPYWGKMHAVIPEILSAEVKKGDLVLAPFCRTAAPLLAALGKGAGLVAFDPDPAAVLLARTLIQPVGLFALQQGFHQVAMAVSGEIQDRYTIACPGCRKMIPFKELVWGEGVRGGIRPDRVVIGGCRFCGWKGESKLTGAQTGRQLKLSQTEPVNWFPKNRISGRGDKNRHWVKELYTPRNLASLADLNHAVMERPAGAVRDALVSVFLSVALRSIGPTLPPGNMEGASQGAAEANVWQVFEEQFQWMTRIRQALNAELTPVRIVDTLDELEDSDNAAYIEPADCLSFPIPGGRKVTHVLLDLPGSLSDEDILLAGLQAAWLKAAYTPNHPGSPGGVQDADGKQGITACLERVLQNTGSTCRITIALHGASEAAEEIVRDIVAAAGGSLQEIQPVPASFGGGPWNRKMGKYYMVARKRRPAKTGAAVPLAATEADELRLFMRAAAFLEKTQEGKTVADRLFVLLRDNLKSHYAGLAAQERKDAIADSSRNQKAFHRLCLHLLSIILDRDRYRIVAGRKGRFDQAEDSIFPDLKELEEVGGALKACDMVARNNAGRQIFFCLYEPVREGALKKFAARVYRQDGQRFDQLCYLIFRDRTEMDQCRKAAWADNWPRGFFVCVSDLLRQASRMRRDLFGNPAEPVPDRRAVSRKQAVKHFTAEVLRNSPVGMDEKPLHYKLQFQTDDMRSIGPGQFIMVDPLPPDRRKQAARIRHKDIFGSAGNEGPVNRKDLTPQSYLKRPFGVQRAYYKHFAWGYHATLSLPPMLAGITHTVFPHKFEMLYKVIDGGIGTPEMTGLQPGARIKVLGPLGKYTHIPDWRLQGVEEVHLVGGGVGMAPLVFFGQALKFYAFRVKAFIGIDRMASLAESRYGRTFSEEAGREYVYIEELSRIGLTPGEIFLSREYGEEEPLSDKIAQQNYYCGLVTEQYNSVLAGSRNRKNTLIIACGPKPMMIALKKVAARFGMPMKVLLEKRMGCGIGVCMSCVCRTRTNNTSRYSRVCVDGPIFDAEDIEWEAL